MFDGDDLRFDQVGGFNTFYPPQGFNVRYAGRQRQFRRFYSAYPVAAHPEGNKQNLNYGGKIFMPASALDEISQLEVVYPLLFKLQNDEGSECRRTHCGVLEFTAEEGRAYLPQWMMETLHLEPGATVEVINVALLRGSMVKLQPQSTDFLDISDHRAVLENALRLFSALTVGDVVAIQYNGHEYKIGVLETQPSPSAINVVETDLSVDFAPPVGYVEPSVAGSGEGSNSSRPSSSIAKAIKSEEERAKERLNSGKLQKFAGSGQKLSNRVRKGTSSLNSHASTPDNEAESNASGREEEVDQKVPIPLDIPLGTLFFGYPVVPPPGAEPASSPANKKGPKFIGEGRTLRQSRKR
ncbi:ubiquitin fusion degradation protein [Coemansia spiralis]|uniref:Ubiquitin fusion degradation protein n=2 Tax=Coemansia TaxID=4863 RepID=A0A9W8KYL1_9FUNG|nr:ubiquitin fusion degradation protein [Coemansia umbellata]KAJ2622285.1 ubiquitin fusion degradation protein [Coemansia sp. RSA 1358]KAJ2677761.1 ubiquitin fusion degradation protein [Coemansia spiralis]